MKFVKSISLFFVIPVLLIMLGFLLGNKFSKFFYPGDNPVKLEKQRVQKEQKEQETVPDQTTTMQSQMVAEDFYAPVSAGRDEIIDADTQFLVEEADLRRNTIVETECRMPEKYLGMDRESFLKAMEEYELSPPLTELERGFVSLEIKQFSSEHVLVRMNYVYTAPSTSFYLMAEKHTIIVYCDDQQTIYMKTSIQLDHLPEELQQKIIQGMFVEDEKTLYEFLESYSS